ncbi:hypothetical protein [Rhizobacter fulvus]|jgi:hypothetical protein
MNRSTLRRTTTLFAAAPLALLLGCGNSLSGTYGQKGGVNFEFHSNGKVELDVIGPIQEATYVVEDGKVKITNGSQGTMVLKIDDKGCLDGGMMMGKLCKL